MSHSCELIKPQDYMENGTKDTSPCPVFNGAVMGKTIHTKAVDDLFDAILQLETREECYKFFEDVCTINEILSFAQRMTVARMLIDGKTYLEISEVTGASTATISRVNRSLTYGADGYKIVFERLEED